MAYDPRTIKPTTHIGHASYDRTPRRTISAPPSRPRPSRDTHRSHETVIKDDIDAREVREPSTPVRTTTPVREVQASLVPVSTPRPVVNPSPLYAAMGVSVEASKSGWDTVPIRAFESNNIYRFPANNYIYILGPSGQVAQYQPRHNRLYAQVGSGEARTVDYPNWFDDDTVNFIEDMGGVVDDPFYSEN